MNCRDIKTKLGSYVEGRLSGIDRNQVEAHLRECQSCRTALAKVDRVAALLVLAENPAVPPGLTNRIMTEARVRISSEPTANWNPIAWLRLASIPTRVAATVVLLIGLTLGLKLGATTVPADEQITVAQDDPLEVYQISYIADLPTGSIAETYMGLISPAN